MKYLLCFLMTCSVCFSEDLNVDNLDAAAVTIKANGGQGSGSIILKKMMVGGEEKTVAFVLTAAHVISTHRSIRTEIKDGVEKKVVEFSDPGILQEIYFKGRRVGEIKLDAKVIRYSDSEEGHDLAILMLYANDKFSNGISFVQDEDYVPPKGMPVIHIGSSNGQIGSNSFTVGNISQTGRLLDGIGSGSGFVFDQTSVSSAPGSSGCMILRQSDGKLCGMLVRGGSPTFNFIVPIRRIREWSEKAKVEFLFDESAPVPSLEEVLKTSIE